MKNDGKSYEEFVQKLQQALIDSEEYLKQKNIKIEKNKKLKDNRGRDREFDLYWEYELAEVKYKTVIECKDYNSKISIEKIDALVGKIQDFPDLKPIFATKVGYQKGAEEKAKDYKIELLIVREQNDNDWEDKDGTPLIKSILINAHILHPVKIIEFKPIINKSWIENNTNFDISKPMTFSGMTNEIIIEDKIKNEKYSLYDLEHKLGELSDDTGELSHTQEFEDAYISYNNFSLKLQGYSVKYYQSSALKITNEIDFSKELIGVIEYLNKNTTVAIFKDKIVKDWK